MRRYRKDVRSIFRIILAAVRMVLSVRRLDFFEYRTNCKQKRKSHKNDFTFNFFGDIIKDTKENGSFVF